LSDLGTLGTDTRAYGINDSGQVVGYSRVILPDSSEASRAFLWEDGVIEDLGVLSGEDFSFARDINDAGDVVGGSWHHAGTQFFAAEQATLWPNGGRQIVDLGLTPGPEVCTIGYPFYTSNRAEAINNNGQIVGHARCISSGAYLAAFLWQDGIMHNLNDLIPPDSGWQLRTAWDINDHGMIVGQGLPPDGGPYDIRAFLLMPSASRTDDTRDTGLRLTSLGLTASPNPFRSSMSIRYTLQVPSLTSLAVHDLLGRRIATLSNGDREAGRHADTWTGLDDAGRSVPMGVYLLRLEAQGRVETQRVIFLK
jgi:probable HAF family extracellular repeat protein